MIWNSKLIPQGLRNLIFSPQKINDALKDKPFSVNSFRIDEITVLRNADNLDSEDLKLRALFQTVEGIVIINSNW